MIDRPLYLDVWRELAAGKEMVFLAGPRQCGKTTLAKRVAKEFTDSVYVNWDYVMDRKQILADPDFFTRLPRTAGNPPLIIFDEIHKYRKWKSYLKGVYDVFHDRYRFLVSGSGRLDVYQRGGDSLAGRYDLFHLWPFTLAELANERREGAAFFDDPMGEPALARDRHRKSWDALMTFSGFPEPFLAASQPRWKRWSAGYGRQLIREDIRDMADLKHIDLVEALYEMLPDRIGSLLSLNALSELLQVSYNSVKSWVGLLERFFMVFRIAPWSQRVSRSLRKEQKVYLFDLPRIRDPHARFENAVALELWRAATMWTDRGVDEFRLHFVRNKEKEEVDFLLVRNRRPWLLIETKTSDSNPSPVLRKFQRQLRVPSVQLTNTEAEVKWYANNDMNILVAPAWKWIPALP